MIRGFLILLALLLPGAAVAHTRSESHTSWLVDGSSVHLTFSVSDAEARRLTRDGRPPNVPQLVAYLRRGSARARAGGPAPRLRRRARSPRRLGIGA